MKVSIKKIHGNSKVPGYAHGTDAGIDLYYYGDDVMLAPGARGVFATGIAIAIPRLYVGLIWDKSGVATKEGLKVLGGVVDAGYRGEVMVALLNTSSETVLLTRGRKLAQMLIQPVMHPHIEIVDGELPAAEDERGEGGFGSTGLN
jgi:dUTP pyrophosphatase